MKCRGLAEGFYKFIACILTNKEFSVADLQKCYIFVIHTKISSSNHLKVNNIHIQLSIIYIQLNNN